MGKSLLAFKAWGNSVVADDLHVVSLDGTILKLTRSNAPDVVLAELDMADPPPEEDPAVTAAKKESPKDVKK